MRSLLVGVMAVAVGFGVVLGIGFCWQPASEWGVVGGLTICLISLGIAFPLLGISPWAGVERWWRGRSARPVVLTGGRPENRAAQIAYELNSAATATCEHLVPMERAMRGSGMDARLLPESDFESVIAVKCRIYPVGLKRAFSLPEFVYYEERYHPERWQFDNPRANVVCEKCREAGRRSGIEVLHPDLCGAETRWFPSIPPEEGTA